MYSAGDIFTQKSVVCVIFFGQLWTGYPVRPDTAFGRLSNIWPADTHCLSSIRWPDIRPSRILNVISGWISFKMADIRYIPGVELLLLTGYCLTEMINQESRCYRGVISFFTHFSFSAGISRHSNKSLKAGKKNCHGIQR